MKLRLIIDFDAKDEYVIRPDEIGYHIKDKCLSLVTTVLYERKYIQLENNIVKKLRIIRAETV